MAGPGYTFGWLEELVSINFPAGGYAVIYGAMSTLPTDPADSVLNLTGANIVTYNPKALFVAGDPLPIASVPFGATGFGDDLAGLAPTYKIWRSATTAFDAGNGFSFIVLPLKYYKGGTIQLGFDCSGNFHSCNITCLFMSKLKALSVRTSDGFFQFTNRDDTVLSTYLDMSTVLASGAAWGAAGLVDAIGAMQLGGSAVSNPGTLAINVPGKVVVPVNNSGVATKFQWP
jgi:hypothetical protein